MSGRNREDCQGVVCVSAAHEGRWYAAFQVDERLATIGYDDGLIRFWKLADGHPVCIDKRPALYGVTDAEVFCVGSPPGIGMRLFVS